MTTKKFISERVSKTADITINGTINEVFPLFGAFEEKKWAQDWNPQLIYPGQEIMAEGLTFMTKAHGHGENNYLWIVTQCNPEFHHIQYLVSTPNRYWTITIQCRDVNKIQTAATITYSFTGLNEAGNDINKRSLEMMYKNELRDWEKGMDLYMKNKIN